MNFGQKIKTCFVLFLLKIFRILELGNFVAKNLFRALVLTFIITVFFVGFYLESEEPDFYRYVPGIVVFKSGSKSVIPIVTKNIPFPMISAKSAIAIDVKSERRLYELDIHMRYPMASTTKLMTAIVANELYDYDEFLSTPIRCTNIAGSSIGLLVGEEMQVSDLMTALLVSSSNDAACVLANGKIPLAEFINRMNVTAQSMGLEDTLFDNPIGFDSATNSNYSTVYDLYILAKEALKSDFIRDTVNLGETTLKTGVSPRKIYTTNHLLWAIPESYGVKTGKTLAAGEVLIYGYRKAEKDILIVVMGSEERFIDVRHILDWVLESYSWE